MMSLNRRRLALCVVAILVSGCESNFGNSAAVPQSVVQPAMGPVPLASKRCPTSTCIYVADPRNGGGTITVFPANATGNVAPFRTISELYNVYGVAVDQVGRTYVEQQSENKVSVYGASAHGNVPPLFTIAGPRTHIEFLAGIVLDSASRLHVLSVYYLGRVTVYRAGAKGDARPINTIEGRFTKMVDPFSIGVDTSGNTYVTTEKSCSIGCFGKNAILIYAAGTHGHAPPTWIIRGSKTQLSPGGPGAVALDSAGNVYTLVLNDPAPSVNVYAAGAHGNVAPIRVIAGSKTRMALPEGIFVDASGKIYVTNIYPRVSVLVFAPGSTGNVAPIQTITGKKTGLSYPQGIVVR